MSGGDVVRLAHLVLNVDEYAAVSAQVACWGWDAQTLMRRALGLDPGPIPQPDGGSSLHVALFEFGQVVGLAWPVDGGWRCTSDGAFGNGATVREAYEAACLALVAERQSRAGSCLQGTYGGGSRG